MILKWAFQKNKGECIFNIKQYNQFIIVYDLYLNIFFSFFFFLPRKLFHANALVKCFCEKKNQVFIASIRTYLYLNIFRSNLKNISFLSHK